MTSEDQAKTIKTKFNLLVLASCYVLATFTYIFITELFPQQPTATNGAPTGTVIMLNMIVTPIALFEIIVLLSAIALPLFGLWLLLQKFIFKKSPYTEQNFHKIRKIFIIFCILLLLILVIQATQY